MSTDALLDLHSIFLRAAMLSNDTPAQKQLFFIIAQAIEQLAEFRTGRGIQ